MAKHLVIGLGNLGMDIFNALKLQGNEVSALAPKEIHKRPSWTEVAKAASLYDFVWYCIGGGSIEETKRHPIIMERIHVMIPYQISMWLKEDARLILFSSDYALDSSLSTYAKLKSKMEKQFNNHDNVIIFRVNCLYGFHQPEKSIFWKLLKSRYLNLDHFSISDIMVSPTNTKTLARFLCQSQILQNYKTPLNVWGNQYSLSYIAKFLLGINDANIRTKEDSERPKKLPPSSVNFFNDWANDIMPMINLFIEKELMPLYSNRRSLEQPSSSSCPPKQDQECKSFLRQWLASWD